MSSQSPTSTEVLIRRAGPHDAAAVARLAALDSAAPPAGDVLVAIVGGEPWAALSLADGRAVADPFRPSAAAVELLRVRAAHLAAGATGARSASRSPVRLPQAGRRRNISSSG
jgi:hypothetical protein